MFVRQHVGSTLVKTRLTHHGSLRRTFPLFPNEKRKASTALSPEEILASPISESDDGVVIAHYDSLGRLVGEKRRKRLEKEAKECGQHSPLFRIIKFRKDKLPDTGLPVVLLPDTPLWPGSHEISSCKPNKLKEKKKKKDRLAPPRDSSWSFITSRVEAASANRPNESDALTPTTTEVPAEFNGQGDSVEEGWGADELSPPQSGPSSDTPERGQKKNAFPPKGSPTKFQTRLKLVRSHIAESNVPWIPHDAVLLGVPFLPLAHGKARSGVLEHRMPSQGPILREVKPSLPHRPIATLANDLDRVLFNPGVHWLQDPRSRVYNFAPWLQRVPKVQEFAFSRVPGFIKSSQDTELSDLAKQNGAKFTGSTSSLTGILGQIYFMLFAARNPSYKTLSGDFVNKFTGFTPGQRLPVSVLLRYKDGIYSTDSHPKDPGWAEKNVLTWMGTMLEKFLTTDEQSFQKYLRSNPGEEEMDNRPEAYHYAQHGNYLMRSQLDCHDPRLPGTGVFDVKTRAALPIRLDMMNYEENSGYLIRTLRGQYESFEREYYDLIRSAFLKYSFQARIGDMDGIFVTYHNTSQIFGFEYVPLHDMDECLYGKAEAGPPVFDNCIQLLEIISNEIVTYFPEQTVSCTWSSDVGVNANGNGGGALKVFIEPYSWNHFNGEKPIVQLDVTAINYIGDAPIRPVLVPDHMGPAPWTVHWSITTCNDSHAAIRSRLAEVQDTQSSYWSLPTGVDVESMENRWHSINYGNSQTKIPFPQKMFKAADGGILRLRKLAQMGKEDTARLAKIEKGKPKIVLGTKFELGDLSHRLKNRGSRVDASEPEEDVVEQVEGDVRGQEPPMNHTRNVDALTNKIFEPRSKRQSLPIFDGDPNGPRSFTLPAPAPAPATALSSETPSPSEEGSETAASSPIVSETESTAPADAEEPKLETTPSTTTPPPPTETPSPPKPEIQIPTYLTFSSLVDGISSRLSTTKPALETSPAPTQEDLPDTDTTTTTTTTTTTSTINDSNTIANPTVPSENILPSQIPIIVPATMEKNN